MVILRPNRAVCQRGQGIVAHQLQTLSCSASVRIQDPENDSLGLLICAEGLMGNCGGQQSLFSVTAEFRAQLCQTQRKVIRSFECWGSHLVQETHMGL